MSLPEVAVQAVVSILFELTWMLQYWNLSNFFVPPLISLNIHHMTKYRICLSQDNLLFRRIDILVSLATLYLAGFLVNKCWPVKVSKGNCIYRVTIAKYWQGNCFLSFLCNWRGNLPFFAIIAMKITCYIKNLVSDERKYSFPQLHRRKTF